MQRISYTLGSILLAFALVWGGVGTTAPVRAQGDETFTLPQGDHERGYVLHLPPSYIGNRAPLVIALHGWLGQNELRTRWNMRLLRRLVPY